jgi:hypothetical protein
MIRWLSIAFTVALPIALSNVGVAGARQHHSRLRPYRRQCVRVDHDTHQLALPLPCHERPPHVLQDWQKTPGSRCGCYGSSIVRLRSTS